MNIRQAKEEIKHTVQAYLTKNEYGEYKIPVANQRPMLLIGPPGIGKTAIMKQIANELQVGLVSYTITHHTRQSAIGLPMIEKKLYDGKEMTVTEYTMSEIIASVYDTIEKTGQKEGILFIDEINCVSETLAPTMLQFLQGKTFGAHKVPDGFVIVTAGNPREYNKSVKEFDIVTLDRVRKINVQEDYGVWKSYAQKVDVHNAIISYLDIKKDHFYTIKQTIDGKQFVTARGWEDLSKLLYVYEELGLEADSELVYEYLQERTIAKEFANYLALYYKYKEYYDIAALLQGNGTDEVIAKLTDATFDERVSVISLILAKIYEDCSNVLKTDALVTELFDALKQVKSKFFDSETSETPVELVNKVCKNRKKQLSRLMDSGMIDKKEQYVKQDVIGVLEGYAANLNGKDHTLTTAFDEIKASFGKETARRESSIKQASQSLEQAFYVLEESVPGTQEMIMFITELTLNHYSATFISEYGCEKYYQYNKELMLTKRRDALLDEINEL